MNKLVSIITPAFNSADVIEKCILSVKNQTYNNIEHIIIDGGSNDNTKEILEKYSKEYNLKWVSEKDNGIADAMNKGFKMASGDIFAWIDADNYYDLNIVDEVVKIFNDNIDVVYGNIKIINDVKKTEYIYRPPKNVSFNKALVYSTGSIPAQPAVFFKKEIFDEINGFDPSYKVAGDYDFWLKVLATKPSIFYYDKIFGSYIKGDLAASQSIKGIVKGYKEMLLICKKNNQPVWGKILMFLKYAKGFFSFLIKKFI